MSCSCCCCVTPGGKLLEGVRRKELLVREEEEEGAGGEEEEESRRNMDVSLLREQYRSSRETQRRQTQLLLFRTVSEELSEAVSVVPVTQGLTSPPPAVTFNPDPLTYDPWRVHLDLHRRSCPGVTVRLPASSPETTNTSVTGSSRRSSSSSSGSVTVPKSRGRKLSVDSTSELLSSSREMSPCSSFSSTKEEDHFNVERCRDPDSGSSDRSRGVGGSGADPVHFTVTRPLDASEQNPSDGSREDPPDDSQESSAPGSLTSSDESSTPVASVTCSPSSSTTDLHLKENRSADVKTTNDFLQTRNTPAWRGSRKFSAPALRFTRQLSVGGVGSSSGVHQNQNYYPFPSRKAPRISEAARRLGMYSSF
ncbi:uncharacterized protein LOC111237418 isoform X2 [Seriola dumerili]|uniref:uncharacterized protein LOC111237418 isoform X2 n=1 Tax=Seriola dumerili TaxID=41447 RepID=UPI000BBF106B|nr:uncharacterized protein LOC111237418 isoform X2 [Seriola dumerili]